MAKWQTPHSPFCGRALGALVCCSALPHASLVWLWLICAALLCALLCWLDTCSHAPCIMHMRSALTRWALGHGRRSGAQEAKPKPRRAARRLAYRAACLLSAEAQHTNACTATHSLCALITHHALTSSSRQPCTYITTQAGRRCRCRRPRGCSPVLSRPRLSSLHISSLYMRLCLSHTLAPPSYLYCTQSRAARVAAVAG